MKALQTYLHRVFTVDLRALAFLRIGLGFLLLTDLYTRATDLQAHYANDGVLPLHVLFERIWNPFHLSIHTASGLWQVQALLFFVAAVFAVFLLLGYRTRLATVVSWLLLISVQNRNPMILQGGDDLLRMMLFWGMFLPLGREYSIDSKNQPQPDAGTTHFSLASAGFIIQIWILYFFTAQLKTGPEWTTDFTALYYALSLDMIVLPIGKLIYPYPGLLKFLTMATWYGELLLPFLLFVPYRNSLMRMVVIIALFVFHIGISLTLFVGLFYLINMVSLLALLPPKAMDWITRRRHYNTGQRMQQLRRLFAKVPRPVQVEVKWRSQPPGWLRTYGPEMRSGLLATAILYIAWWNFDNSRLNYLPMPEQIRWPAYVLRLDQNWGMFAPAVFKDDGWFILEGRITGLQALDLNRNGKEVNYEKAASVVSLFKNDRWRKYSENYLFVWNSYLRPYYCNYMLKKWNTSHPDRQLTTLDVVYMKEVSLPDYKVDGPRREVLCSCAWPSGAN